MSRMFRHQGGSSVEKDPISRRFQYREDSNDAGIPMSKRVLTSDGFQRRRFQCLDGSDIKKVPMSRRFQCQEDSSVKKIPVSRRFQCLEDSSVKVVAISRRFKC